MKLKTILCSGVICSLLISGMAHATNGNNNSLPSLGANPLDQQQTNWINENMSKNHPINNNQLAINRINEKLQAKGLSKINANAAVPMGKELDTQAQAASTLTTSSTTATSTVATTVLPDAVDNSALGCFPPIRNQGSLGSCVAFGTTYYQLTHMTGLIRNWDVKNDTANNMKFSPKWTYNMCNDGDNGGMTVAQAYKLLSKSGACLWSEFPYDTNYKEWNLISTTWRNASKYKVDSTGYITIQDSSNSNTPVTSASDSELTLLKNYLNNGYILTFTTRDPLYDWNYKTISNDSSTTADDSFVNQNVCYREVYSTSSRGGHCMTVVGYNDNIWVDINNNNTVDQGEKGALKIANSWGNSSSDNMNSGFYWVAYDALNKASSVSGVTNPTGREFILGGYNGYNTCYWMNVKESNEPKLLARFTIRHSLRDDMRVQIGYSEIGATSPAQTWSSEAFFYSGGSYALDGTGDGTGNTSYIGSFTLDFTDLIKQYNLANGTAKRWYLILQDSTTNNKPITLTNYSLIDSNGNVLKTTGALSQEIDGSTANLYLDYTIPTTQNAWVNKTNATIYRSSSASSVYNNLIYIAGGYDDYITAKNTMYEYNPSTGSMTAKNNMQTARADAGAATLINKIYVVGGFNGTALNSMEEYNPSTNTWTSKANMTTARHSLGVAAANGKIYAIGGFSGSTAVNTVEEYNPVTNTWTTKTSMPTARHSFGIVSYNGKIYVIGGVNSSNTRCNTLEVYNPLNDTWDTTKASMPTAREGLSCTTYNGKIYAVGGFKDSTGESNKTEAYDPSTNTWVTLANLNHARCNLSVGCANNKLYAIGGISGSGVLNYVEELVP